MDDLQDEAEKQNVREKASDAKRNAKGLVNDAKDRFGASEPTEEDTVPEEEPEGSAQGGATRRSKRTKKAAGA